jgi:ActR/RegA family two-component response regulator
MDAKVVVLIVDDDAEIRRMLRRGFARDGRFGAMAEAGSVAEAVAWARVATPGVAVINQMRPTARVWTWLRCCGGSAPALGC